METNRTLENLQLTDNIKLENYKLIPITYQWFQSSKFITINFTIKDIKFDDLYVTYLNKILTVYIIVSNSDGHKVELDLAEEFDYKDSYCELTNYKVEIKLKKLGNYIWTSLLKTEIKPKNIKPTYPSSAKNKKDWVEVDKLVKKETEERSFNETWQDIWKNADDETKNAIEKSMTDSGGTVLNMNWGEVKKDKIKPYDGYGTKEWDEKQKKKYEKQGKRNDLDKYREMERYENERKRREEEDVDIEEVV